MAELSPKLKREFFITTLSIFDESADNSHNFHRERENWESIIQHRQDLVESEALNVNVLVDFPDTFSSDDANHLQGLIKYWNDLTSLLETVLNMKVRLFQFEFETEMRNPATIFRSKGERRIASPSREASEPSPTETTDEKDPDAEGDDKDPDDDDDKELDDSNFDVYWNI